ncbi:MAG: YIP1 family protein [Vicinamibacteria bacterium]|nr:YIP1 family protein [Vicinamibacteria bacterium]
MTETLDPAAPPPDSGSFFGNLFNLYFEPAETFAKIFTRPRILMALVLQIGLGVLFTSIWLQKVDAREFMRQQMEQNPRIQQMPAEQVKAMIDGQAKFMMSWGRVAPFIAPAVLDLVVAGILMFIFRFFLAAEVSFLQSLAAVVWTFAAVGLVQTPIMLSVFWLKEDWNIDPNSVIQANPTIFFQQSDLPRWLWSLLGSFDLFSLWVVFLLATGFAVAGRRGLSSGLWGIGIPWAIVVMIKVGFALMFG